LLHDPLVYAITGVLSEPFDPSLIEAGLPVGSPGTLCAEDLPYRQSYRECSPQQRAVYLAWLTGGRQDPSVPVGYVFIYFYGLERRVLVDGQDHNAVVKELLRLLPIYGRSHSFRRYASGLLWMAIWLATDHGGVSVETLKQARSLTASWDDNVLATALACLWKQSIPLPSSLAYTVAGIDPRCPRSVVTTRHGDKFRKLFRRKYKALFGSGLALQVSKRARSLEYRAAGAALARLQVTNQLLSHRHLPNVLGITKQFKPLVDLWSECIDELKTFDRAQQVSGTEAMTAVTYEALPKELRTGDHPEFDQWWQLKNQYADEAGWTIAPISAVAQLKGIQGAPTLTKRQCMQLLCTADAIGLGIEPDLRLTGRKYRWDDRVSIFLREEEEKQGEAASYVAAATLLCLGVRIAEADGTIDTRELAYITEHIEEQFDLSPGYTRRLEHLRHLLVTTPSDSADLVRRLQKSLNVEQRRLVGSFLVSIAVLDQAVTEGELRALRQTYRLLDLDPVELDSLLSSGGAASRTDDPVTIQQASPSGRSGEEIQHKAKAPACEVFALNMAAVSRIRLETKEVAALLREAMAVTAELDEDDLPSARTGPGTDRSLGVMISSQGSTTAVLEPPVEGAAQELGERFRPFLDAVIASQTWTRQELTAVARQHNIMLNGAIETINEWSQERFGDWLIDDGEPIRINVGLLKNEES